jgi:hypothetical protein
MDNVTPLSQPDEGLTRFDPHGRKNGMTDFDGLPVLIAVPRAASCSVSAAPRPIGTPRLANCRSSDSVAASLSSGTDFVTFWRRRERPRSSAGKDLPLLL